MVNGPGLTPCREKACGNGLRPKFAFFYMLETKRRRQGASGCRTHNMSPSSNVFIGRSRLLLIIVLIAHCSLLGLRREKTNERCGAVCRMCWGGKKKREGKEKGVKEERGMGQSQVRREMNNYST